MKRLLLLCMLMFAALPLMAADFHNIKPLALGSTAPDFDLPGVDGRNHSLKEYAAAKILVIYFTCNHCPTAQNYEDRIKQIVTEYAPKGVQVVAIMPNDPKSVRLDELGYTDLSDSFEEMKTRAAERQFNYPYLYDGDTENVSVQYGPAATPHAFVFDEKRVLRYSGRIDDSERPAYAKTHELRDALDSLLAGKDPLPNQTHVFGCSTKWAGKTEDVQKYMDRLNNLPVNVELVDAEGLAALRKNSDGKVLLVNFWATWCGPCVTEFPDLVTIQRMYGHRKFEVVTVSGNLPEERKEVLGFLKKQHAASRNLLFGSADKDKLIDAFDKTWSGALPFTVLLNPAGEVLYREEGPFDDMKVKKLIVKTLKEDRFKD